MLSTTTQPTATGTVLRRQKDGSRIPVPCPEAIISYNECAVGEGAYRRLLQSSEGWSAGVLPEESTASSLPSEAGISRHHPSQSTSVYQVSRYIRQAYRHPMVLPGVCCSPLPYWQTIDRLFPSVAQEHGPTPIRILYSVTLLNDKR